MSHGYEVSLTPLQTLTFYNAIANNGRMVKPKFVNQVRIGEKVVKNFEEEVLVNKIASQENISKTQQLLQNVVAKKTGTGRKLYEANFSMAGKTGTCWKNYWANADEKDYISSFVGYFPADKPKYSCIVVIHEPNQDKGIYGADVAGPVFKSMAQKIYLTSPVIDQVTPTIQVEPQLEKVFENYYAAAQKNHSRLPNVKGMSGMDAVSLLENLGLQVLVKGNGKVVEQSLPEGSILKAGKTIILKLS